MGCSVRWYDSNGVCIYSESYAYMPSYLALEDIALQNKAVRIVIDISLPWGLA